MRDRRNDEQHAHDGDGDALGDVADHAEHAHGVAGPARRQGELLLEVLADAADDERDTDPEDDEPDQHEQHHAARRRQQGRAEGLRRLRGVGRAAEGVDERGRGDREVGEGGAHLLHPSAPLLLRVGVALEERLGDLPHAERGQAEDDHPEHDRAERDSRDLLHRPALVGLAAAGADRDGDGDRADDQVHEAEHDVAHSGHGAERSRALGGARGRLEGIRVHRHSVPTGPAPVRPLAPVPGAQ